MSERNAKRIVITLPQNLLKEVDGVAAKQKSNRSELIRQAMRFYLRETKKKHIRDMMQKGYVEMASINLHIASEAFQAEEEADYYTANRLVNEV